MPGTQIAAGNFLLCFAILMAGGSASKVLNIFQHMGLGCVSLRSFFRYQKVRASSDCILLFIQNISPFLIG